jgi:signal transduction histidine kinase
MRLVVRDDGRGAPEENLGHEASRILALVRDRADAVGGLVDVVARPGEGTEVAVTVRRLP